MRVFIAGPSSGVPCFNVKAFDRADLWLRTSFDIIHNPAVHRREELNVPLENCPNGDFNKDLNWSPTQQANYARHTLAWDCAKLGCSDVIALLPGWNEAPYSSHLYRQALFMGVAPLMIPQHVVDTPIDGEDGDDAEDGDDGSGQPAILVLVPDDGEPKREAA